MQAAQVMTRRPDENEVTAMSIVTDRQLRRTFAGCERMELLDEGKAIRVGAASHPGTQKAHR